MNQAIINDINKQYLEAVKCYEAELVNSPSADIFTNLAFLYWSFATEQIEFNDPNDIPQEWSIIGEKKFLLVIDKGLENYPNHLELVFWRQYFSYRLYVTDFSENDCKALLKKYGGQDSLVPYFFLNLFDNESYKEQITRLREVCNDLPTAKNLYISSFIGRK